MKRTEAHGVSKEFEPEDILQIKRALAAFRPRVEELHRELSPGALQENLDGLIQHFVDEAMRRVQAQQTVSLEQLAETRSALEDLGVELVENEFHVRLRQRSRLREAMEFEINGEVVPEPPTEGMIARGLRSLRGGYPSFVILSRSPMTYVQAGGSPTTGFELEYQEGTLTEHYRSAAESLDLATVTRVLQLYLRGDEGWRTEVRWYHSSV